MLPKTKGFPIKKSWKDYGVVSCLHVSGWILLIRLLELEVSLQTASLFQGFPNAAFQVMTDQSTLKVGGLDLVLSSTIWSFFGKMSKSWLTDFCEDRKGIATTIHPYQLSLLSSHINLILILPFHPFPLPGAAEQVVGFGGPPWGLRFSLFFQEWTTDVFAEFFEFSPESLVLGWWICDGSPKSWNGLEIEIPKGNWGL